MYLVTLENSDTGMWLDDPEGFNTVTEAVSFATNRQPPTGHCYTIYECQHLVSYPVSYSKETGPLSNGNHDTR